MNIQYVNEEGAEVSEIEAVKARLTEELRVASESCETNAAGWFAANKEISLLNAQISDFADRFIRQEDQIDTLIQALRFLTKP